MKKVLIVLAVAGAIFALFMIFVSLQNKTSTNTDTFSLFPSRSQGLGSLCASEAECTAFCHDNLKQCEKYCHGRGDLLCQKMFPPETYTPPQDISPSSSLQPTPQNTTPKKPEQNCVNNSSPLFTHSFIDISKISWISQYGNNAIYNPGSQARSYVAVKKGESTPVYAPVNATLIRMHYSNKNYPGLVRPEYRLNFQASCEVSFAFDHIISVVDKLKEQAPQTPAEGRNDGNEVTISVQAGELLGYTSGTIQAGSFDFVFLNTARPHQYLNPARWHTENSIYIGCPYDYFTEDLKQQYLALIGIEKGVRSCGPRVQEIPSSVFGYWFQGNATETNGPRLALYETSHFVEWTIIKDSESPTAFRDSNGGRTAPDTITEGKSACYYDKERKAYLYLKMLPNDRIALVSGTGSCPSSFPQEYEVWMR